MANSSWCLSDVLYHCSQSQEIFISPSNFHQVSSKSTRCEPMRIQGPCCGCCLLGSLKAWTDCVHFQSPVSSPSYLHVPPEDVLYLFASQSAPQRSDFSAILSCIYSAQQILLSPCMTRARFCELRMPWVQPKSPPSRRL